MMGAHLQEQQLLPQPGRGILCSRRLRWRARRGGLSRRAFVGGWGRGRGGGGRAKALSKGRAAVVPRLLSDMRFPAQAPPQ